ncbi:hypothetical protein FVEN_g2170 [Fusarium venenatum]|uniref:BZIP domain-containing protein n=1 Tax=Fusarium venenatum TaxID=56646 RepID=A0A2L2SPQ8_9HYPO|nr:uncharacterized protein FVRRES_12585 [Fusarium venenatum]KAG8360344.1 hypothetical protein FVEN_g2170 [Fusarium venenatum]KAH6979191.1 hypothetical protein EDB82DRAFT_546967 [Fusarium venenatum]CEI39894.1 unnamed protein product [Fusarium venenatum]
MDNVDLTHQQPPEVQEHPPGVVFAPVPDMGAIAQGVPGMNPCSMLPEAHWGQWWSPNDAAFAESANVTAPVHFGQEQHLFYNNSTLNPEQVTQWDSPSTSTHSYPLLSPSTEATSFVESPSKSRRSSSVTQTDQRRRKRSTAAVAATAKHKSQPTTTKPTRRASARKTSKAEPDTTAASEKPRRGKRSKATTKTPPKPERNEEYDDDEYDDAEVDPEQEYDIHSKKVQERNRIASNKFRVKKREDAIKLRVDEEDMERSNRDLSNCVSDLTMEIYDLKMKLLQHTDCDCALIQDYIASEAKRYIKDLGEGKHPNATPPLPPQPPFQHIYH